MVPPFRPGLWVATNGLGPEMASRQPGSPGPKGKDWKKSDPLVRAGADWPLKMPQATALVRAARRFKLLTPEAYQSRLLASIDPLALDKEPSQMPGKQEITPEETFWGDHQYLSKVRTTPGLRGPCSTPPPMGGENAQASK